MYNDKLGAKCIPNDISLKEAQNDGHPQYFFFLVSAIEIFLRSQIYILLS